MIFLAILIAFLFVGAVVICIRKIVNDYINKNNE